MNLKIKLLNMVTTLKLAPGINEDEAKNLINQYADPIQNILLFAIPIIAGIAILVSGGSYLVPKVDGNKKEDEEKTGVKKRVVGIIAVAVFLEISVVIWKIFTW